MGLQSLTVSEFRTFDEALQWDGKEWITMDELDMMSLELPDTGGLANADDVSAAEAQEPGDEGAEDNVSYEYDGTEIPEESVPMPVLSEMDGSEFNSGEVSSPKPYERAGGDAGQGLPELSDMSDMPYSRSTAGRSAGSSGSAVAGGSGNYGGANASGAGFGGGYSGGQGTYSPVSGNPVKNTGYGGSQGYNAGGSGYSQSQGRTNYFDLLDEETALAAKGEKVARVIGNITLVISILDGLVGLLGFNVRVIFAAVYHIYFCIQFKKGSRNSRYWLGIGCVLTVIVNIISMLRVDSLTETVVALTGSSTLITIVQLIVLIPVILFAVLAYFYLFDKSVAAYCERNSGRVD